MKFRFKTSHSIWGISTLIVAAAVVLFLVRGVDPARVDEREDVGVGTDVVRSPHGETLTESSRVGQSRTAPAVKDFGELMRRWAELEFVNLSEDDKKTQYCILIESMVQAGHYQEAKKLALEVDQGRLRGALIHSLFSREPRDIDALLDQAKDPAFGGQDLEDVRAGMMQNLSTREGIKRVTDYLKTGKTQDEQTVKFLFLSAFSYMDPVYNAGGYLEVDAVGETRNPDEAERRQRSSYILANLKSLVDEYPQHSSSILSGLLDALDPRMPQEALSVLSEYSDKIGSETTSHAAREALMRLFDISPDEALLAAGSLEGNVDIANAIGPGIKAWLKNDSTSVRKWLSGRGKQASTEVFDRVSSEASDYLAKIGKIEEASSLADGIRDSAERAKVLERVSQQKAEKFYADAKSDYQGSLDLLTKGEGNLPAHYIERTLGDWIKNDAEKASDWCKNNWGYIESDKRQFVAAACALDAANKGDPAVAEQWLSFIEDPDTRNRVQKAISKSTVTK